MRCRAGLVRGTAALLAAAGRGSGRRGASVRVAPSGALACVRSAYVRLRAQAGESSKRRII